MLPSVAPHPNSPVAPGGKRLASSVHLAKEVAEGYSGGIGAVPGHRLERLSPTESQRQQMVPKRKDAPTLSLLF